MGAEFFEGSPYVPLGGVMLVDYRHGQYSSLLPTAAPSDLVRAHGGSAVQAFPQAATKQYITFAVAMA